MIHEFSGTTPSIHPSAFVVDSAQIIGDVTIGENSSVWYHAVVRGDINAIRIGMRTNIQDSSTLHVRQGFPLTIGSHVTVGHGAILHACRIDDRCLIGMGAIVLDNVYIKQYTLIAAGTVVRNNSIFEEGVLVAGVPGKVIRTINNVERSMIEESAQHYVEYSQMYRQSS